MSLTGRVISGVLRKLYVYEFCHLYSSPDIDNVMQVRKIRWLENIASKAGMRNNIQILSKRRLCKRKL